MSPSGTDPVRAAADFIDAFNRSDWETYRSLMADDVVYTETGTGRRVEGVDAYVELVQGWKEALPDVNGTIRNAVASGDTAVQELLWEGTHTGAMQTPGGTLEASGERVSVEGSIWTWFEGGKIREVHHYLDVLLLLQQIGAMPAGTST